MKIALFLLCAACWGQSFDFGTPGDGCSGKIYSDPAIQPDPTMRFGVSFACDIPTPGPAIYRLTLQFSEPDPAKLAGQRVFRVVANGVDSGPIDLVKSGCLAKQPCSVLMLVTAGPNVRLQVTASAGNAVLSGAVLQSIPLLVSSWASCSGGDAGSDCTGLEAFSFTKPDGSVLGSFVASPAPGLVLDAKWTVH